MKARFLLAAATATLFFSAAPAMAQAGGRTRESIQFLDAIRKQDGTKVNEFLRDSTKSYINSKDVYTGEAALHIIVKRADSTYLDVMLGQRGINVNIQDKEGNTPLMLAVDKDWSTGVAKLISAKANVNATNAQGETALIRAVLAHDPEVVRLLLDSGADPDRADYRGGMNARQYAQQETRFPQIAKMLVEAKKVQPSRGVAGPHL